MNKHLVFVYGTLRRGSVRSMSLRFPSSKFIAEAKVSGSLYDLGVYPGLLLSESNSLVTGEVYEVDDETLNELDDIEAASDYRRKQVEISLGTDRKTCWIYVPEQDPEFYSARTPITSGDWIEYAKTKGGSGMAAIEAVLVDNFKEALRQANRYLTLGLFSSLFILALSLDPNAFTSSGNVSLPGGLPPLPVRYARIALAMIYLAVPFLADFSLARAERVGARLQQSNPELLKAAATYPSIVTTRVHGPRWITALVPPLVVGIAGWMNGIFSFSWRGLLYLGVAVVPYLTLFGLRLRRAFGDLRPDAHGD